MRCHALAPKGHPLADCDRFPVNALCDYPFMLLEKGAKAEISEIFEKCNLAPNIHFTTWDDYAIMSMLCSTIQLQRSVYLLQPHLSVILSMHI